MTSTTRTGHIYRIWKPGSTEFYIGSTINFKHRKYSHKCSCTKEGNKNYNFSLYQHIRSNGGWYAWRMDVEHTVQFNQRHELNRIEGEYIRRLKPTLNFEMPGRTPAEYYQDNKEAKKEYDKRYYQANKQTKAEQQKRYYQTNKEARRAKLSKKFDCLCGGKFTHGLRTQHFKTQRHRDYLDTWMLYV